MSAGSQFMNHAQQDINLTRCCLEAWPLLHLSSYVRQKSCIMYVTNNVECENPGPFLPYLIFFLKNFVFFLAFLEYFVFPYSYIYKRQKTNLICWSAGKPFESGSHYWEDTVSGWVKIEELRWFKNIWRTGTFSKQDP